MIAKWSGQCRIPSTIADQFHFLCMFKHQSMRARPWRAQTLPWLLLALFLPGAVCAASPAESATALQSKFRSVMRGAVRNPFQRPLYLESTELSNALAGDIYALMDYPFSATQATFGNPANWCDVLILHINTKHCRSSQTANGAVLAMRIGSKQPEALDRAHLMTFDFRASAPASEYFEVELRADIGPLATRNYQIRLEAAPAQGGKTLLHLRYAYEVGVMGRLAMQAYLATQGRGKVGFTIAGAPVGGEDTFIAGVRGVVERNTMRYYLAIDAYLGALSVPAGEQFEQRIDRWFSGTEQFPRQLHEIDRVAYLAMKRDENRRQQESR